MTAVSADAIVRIWELNVENRWSFDSPTFAVDLKKLADGTSSDQDFGAAGMGRSNGFSPDSFEMDVAAACFGGSASGHESGWAPMTLWLAMREGDVYALCPLLPTKWQPPASLIPSLSVSIVSNFSSVQSDPTSSSRQKDTCRQQHAWIVDIDLQEPAYLPGPSDFDPEVAVYNRPSIQGAMPRLQGPFILDPIPDDGDEDLEVLLTDIYVIGPRLDRAGVYEDDSYEDHVDDGVSASIVCLMTSMGRVHVCLDVDGVEGAWLPTKKAGRSLLELMCLG